MSSSAPADRLLPGPLARPTLSGSTSPATGRSARATALQPLEPGTPLTSRSLGWLTLASVATYSCWLTLRSGTAAAPLLVATLPALAMSLALFRGALDGRSAGAFKVAMALGTLTLAAALCFGGGRSAPLAMFTLWFVPYAFVGFALRDALVQLAFAAVCLGAALALRPALYPGLAYTGRNAAALWLVTVSTALAVGLLFRGLGHRLRAVDLRVRQSFEQAAVGMAMLSSDGTILEVNGALCGLLQAPPCELVGRHSSVFTHRDDPIHTRESLASLQPGSAITAEKRLLHPDGRAIWCRVTTSRIGDGADHFFSQLEDVTERRQAAADAAALARDNQLILECAGDGIFRTDERGVIVYANPACAQMLGYPAGELVGRAADGLMSAAQGDGPHPPGDSRHARGNSPDDPGGGCLSLAAVRAGDVRRARGELMWRRDGTSFWADLTLAPARTGDRIVGAVCVFNDVTEAVEQERRRGEAHATEQMIRTAIREHRLAAYAQPILDLHTNRVWADELLVRMIDRDTGEVLAPAAFLPRAERDGHVHLIDVWMLREAVRRMRSGRRVFVNLSGHSLVDPEVLTTIEHGAIGDAAQGTMVLEITETAMVDRMDEAQRFATRAAELGCRLAIDDFGTGYGGLNYIKGFRADYLKIDREFVHELADDESDQRIVRTIVALARDFGKLTIAEGVEDDRTLELLRGYGVDFAQGFLIGRPAPIDPPHR